MAAQNELETALAKAATDPASRPEFYRVLLDAQVYVVGHADALTSEAAHVLPAGANISIQSGTAPDGTPCIPFFASVEALRRTIQGESRYVQMLARDLFELTRGSRLYLSSASDYGKEFYPNEIEAILEYGVNQVSKRHEFKEDTPVL